MFSKSQREAASSVSSECQEGKVWMRPFCR